LEYFVLALPAAQQPHVGIHPGGRPKFHGLPDDLFAGWKSREPPNRDLRRREAATCLSDGPMREEVGLGIGTRTPRHELPGFDHTKPFFKQVFLGPVATDPDVAILSGAVLCEHESENNQCAGAVRVEKSGILTTEAGQPGFVAGASTMSVVVPDGADAAVISMTVDIEIEPVIRVFSCRPLQRGKDSEQKLLRHVRSRLMSTRCQRVVRGKPLGVPDVSWRPELVYPISDVRERH
jgi:hypothetical protein